MEGFPIGLTQRARAWNEVPRFGDLRAASRGCRIRPSFGSIRNSRRVWRGGFTSRVTRFAAQPHDPSLAPLTRALRRMLKFLRRARPPVRSVGSPARNTAQFRVGTPPLDHFGLWVNGQGV